MVNKYREKAQFGEWRGGMAAVRSLISMVTPASHCARLAGVNSPMRYFHGNVIDPNHRLASRRPPSLHQYFDL